MAKLAAQAAQDPIQVTHPWRFSFQNVGNGLDVKAPAVLKGRVQKIAARHIGIQKFRANDTFCAKYLKTKGMGREYLADQLGAKVLASRVKRTIRCISCMLPVGANLFRWKMAPTAGCRLCRADHEGLRTYNAGAQS